MNLKPDEIILNFLKNIFTRKPKHPTEFVKKFIHDSKKERVQLEVIVNEDVIVQTDSLRFSPTWFNILKVDKVEFKNGFVIFFIIDLGEIEKNDQYILYKKSNLKLMEMDEMFEKTPIRTFAKFIKETDDPVYLGKEIRNVIDGIFKSNENNPQAIFNLRYLNEV